MSAKSDIRHGNEFPFNASDAWWNDGHNPPKAKDWAHRAARGIIANLKGRQGIKHQLSEIDERTRVEIVRELAAIIRSATPSAAQPREK